MSRSSDELDAWAESIIVRIMELGFTREEATAKFVEGLNVQNH